MESLMDESCREFAADLASKRSTPGGGGAAAFAGALGVALGEMVGNFTTGKKKYAAYEDDIARLLAEGERIRLRLLALVDEDAAAFEPLSRAYGIPKEDPNRDAVLEQCTLDALDAPLQMMRETCQAIDVIEELSVKGSRMLLSDVGCGAALCRAALESAALNVFVNTKSLHDRVAAQRIDSECRQMLEKHGPLASRIVETVMGELQP